MTVDLFTDIHDVVNGGDLSLEYHHGTFKAWQFKASERWRPCITFRNFFINLSILSLFLKYTFRKDVALQENKYYH